MNIEEPKKGPENISKKEKLAKDLEVFCAKNGNPIKIIEKGEDLDLEKNEIKPEVLKKIREDEREQSSLYLEVFKTFLNGPIFTDNFNKEKVEIQKNHTERRAWENSVYEKWDKKETRDYYNSNRLGGNNWGHIVTFLDLLLRYLEDSEIKNKLSKLKDEIPNKLTDRDQEGLLKHYAYLEDTEKIECVKELSEITKNIILLLEK